MSKYLIKILSICAFVVLLPLIILGSALCVTEATVCTLTIADGGNNGNGSGMTSNVAIYIDNELVEGKSVTVQKHTEITVTWEGTGYDFAGWYNGNYQEINFESAKPLETETSYTFYLRGNTTLTAVRDVMHYTINYAGTLSDGTTEVSTVIDPTTKEYDYGQPLETLEDGADGATFDGWYVEGLADAIGTKVANFAASGEYTVVPAWSNQMIITYKAGKEAGSATIAQHRVTQASLLSYSLLASDNEDVARYIPAGYAFDAWTNVNDVVLTDGTSIEFQVGTEYVVYLRTEVIDYTLNVKYNALSEQVDTLTYNVVDGFGSYATDGRKGYTLSGFNYNGTLYSYNTDTNDYVNNGVSLGTILTQGDAQTIDVVAVWDCIYPNVTIYYEGLYNYGSYEDYIFVGSENNYEVWGGQLDVAFVDEEGGYDTSDNLTEVLSGLNFYEGHLADDLETMEYNPVTFNGNVKFTVNNIDYTAQLGGAIDSLTYNDIFDYLSRQEGFEIDTIESITVRFMFS